MASKYYQSRSGAMHYDRRGLGSPVVLVHGIYAGASHAEYARTVAGLQRSHTVYALDLLGFGGSDGPRVTHSAQLHHHLLRDFLTEEVGEVADVIASGLGCGLAVRLGVYDPALVRRMVLICPVTRVEAVREQQSLGERISQFVLGTLNAGAGLYEAATTRAVLEQFLRSRYYDGAAVTPEQVDALEEAARGPNAMLPYISLLNGLFDVDTLRWLRHVRAATLVIWGDRLGPPPVEQVMAPMVGSKGKRLEVIERAAHWPHDERSALVNQLLLEFLGEVEKSDFPRAG
jgi:pimeloyl-ACP methyl ester carboxylesterase